MFGILAPPFRSFSNIANFIGNSVPVLLITVGVAIVIIGGGIDLSMGTVAGLSAGVTLWTLVSGASTPIAVLAGVGVGLGFGLLNGLLITIFGISDFIVTLGSLSLASGALAVLVGTTQLSGANNSAFSAIANGSVVGIPNPIWIATIIVLLVQFFLGMTIFGRRTFALGIRSAAADSAGVRIKSVRLLTFTMSGLLAGTAGVLLASQLGAAQAALGAGFNLTAIAGAVIGGVSLAGGRGSAWAAIFGGLLLATIQQGLRFMGIDAIYFTIVTGLCIVGGVVFDRQVRQLGLSIARKQNGEVRVIRVQPPADQDVPATSVGS
ncbi:ABC transporter permease [Nakamurella sp. PAMC28650]|uniref:ABC transporter permease n=1 Tax=Nakamurella sp. PAMC28650 TaxID=2762325 RepID=UPI00164E8CF5|nr:ABC transporter permease [Nakamurella sp. PAMC28650]QNK82934.1 ABC transporter permease [Nakamurella sp. PAMC28650]